jgi:beta-galactosidase
MKSHQLNAKNYTVYYELISPTGKIVSEGKKDALLDMRREDTVRFFANIPDLTPWSHEEPRLYTLFIRTQNEGRFMEYLSFRIGFRQIDMSEGVIRLNGIPLDIVMENYTPAGDTARVRREVEEMLARGVNTLRLHGVPPDNRFYELCNERGIYICQTADIDTHSAGNARTVGGNPSNAPEWAEAYRTRTTDMYRLSRNNPSVIMFSLARNSANGYNLYESYLALKDIEKNRPVIYPEGEEWNNDRVDFAAMSTIDNNHTDKRARIIVTDQNEGRFSVANPRRLTPLIGEVSYSITVGRKIVSKGAIPIRISPGD